MAGVSCHHNNNEPEHGGVILKPDRLILYTKFKSVSILKKMSVLRRNSSKFKFIISQKWHYAAR